VRLSPGLGRANLKLAAVHFQKTKTPRLKQFEAWAFIPSGDER
jgi:hypothetical protein